MSPCGREEAGEEWSGAEMPLSRASEWYIPGQIVSATDSQTGHPHPTQSDTKDTSRVDALRASCWRLSNVPVATDRADEAATCRFADRSVDETDGNQTREVCPRWSDERGREK